MVLSRSERSHLTEWWFTVDRTVLGLSFLLLAFGIVMLLSASPPVAMRKDLPHFFFVQRQLVFAVFGSVLLLAVSFLSPSNIRRLSLALFVLSLISMIGVLLFGPEINGAQRWIRVFGVSLQPSEILKTSVYCINGLGVF